MSSTKVEYPCIKCQKDVYDDANECSLCLKWEHRHCAKLSKNSLVV